MTDGLLVTVARLASRIQEPIETAEDIEAAEELILTASDEARYHGSASWDANNVPPIVKNVVLAACQRAFQNPGHLESERADAVTLSRNDVGSLTVDFTPEEVRRVERAAGKSRGIASVPVTRADRYVPRSLGGRGGVVYVPIDSYAPGAKPFPWGVAKDG